MAAKLDYTWIADAAAIKGGVAPALLSSLINAESAWNPAAVSSTGCTGFGQFCQAAAKDYGLMGDGFDNRKDPALNLTATVKYLADLKRQWGTWTLAVAHYAGQTNKETGEPDFASGYARYSAGQALLATLAMIDGTALPPSSGAGDLVIVVDSVTGHEQSTGRPARFIAPMVALGMLSLIGSAVIVACCAPSQPPQQIAERCAPPYEVVQHENDLHCAPPWGRVVHSSVFDSSTFVLVPGPLGLVTAPIPEK